MKPEDILKQIAKLKTAEEKIACLKSLLKQIKDERVRALVEGLIKQLEPQKKETKEEDIEEIVSELPKGGSASVPESKPLEIEEYKPRQMTIDAEVEAERPEAEKKRDANQTLTSYLRTEAVQRQVLEQRDQLEHRDQGTREYERMMERFRRSGKTDELSQAVRPQRMAEQRTDTGVLPVGGMQVEIDEDRYKRMKLHESAAELTGRITRPDRENHLITGRLYKRREERG